MSISVDLSQLKAYSENLEKIIASGKQKKLLSDCAKELAARLIATVKPRTPVDAGHLRNSWRHGTVEFDGDTVTITVSNPVEYASYVEHGHRIMRGGKQVGVYPGQHFLDISVQEIKSIAPEVLEDKIRAFLEGLT